MRVGTSVFGRWFVYRGRARGLRGRGPPAPAGPLCVPRGLLRRPRPRALSAVIVSVQGLSYFGRRLQILGLPKKPLTLWVSFTEPIFFGNPPLRFVNV